MNLQPKETHKKRLNTRKKIRNNPVIQDSTKQWINTTPIIEKQVKQSAPPCPIVINTRSDIELRQIAQRITQTCHIPVRISADVWTYLNGTGTGSTQQMTGSIPAPDANGMVPLASVVNRPGFPGECFICELRLPDHRFRWKHNKLFLLLPEEYGPAFPAIVDCYTSPPTLVWPVPLLHGFSSSYGVLPPLCKDH